MSRHACPSLGGSFKGHSRGAFLRQTPGLFPGETHGRSPTSLCLQAVCRSILITIQIVIDLPSPGPVATRSHFATLAPIETANTAGPAGAKCSALGWLRRTRVMYSLRDGWIHLLQHVAPARREVEAGCLIVPVECSAPLMYFARPLEQGSRS